MPVILQKTLQIKYITYKITEMTNGRGEKLPYKKPNSEHMKMMAHGLFMLIVEMNIDISLNLEWTIK